VIYLLNPATLLLVYIFYAYLYQARLKNKWLTAIYYPVLIIGALLDVAVNVTWFSVIFWERPKEWMLTKRVERLKSDLGYRGKLALWICELLNKFQAGHCG
jgi:hypothetical protein